MPTKLYLQNKDPEPGTYSFSTGIPSNGWVSWANTAGHGAMIDTFKEGEPYLPQGAHQGWGGGPILLYRGFSRRLTPQTISGTLDVIFQAARGDDSSSVPWTRLYVSIVDTTGGTFTTKAILVNNYNESSVPGAVSWPMFGYLPASITIAFPARSLKAPITITSYTIPNDARDYRIMVEIGCDVASSGSIFYFMNVGTRNTDYTTFSDVIPNGSLPPLAPYVLFSANIGLKASTFPINDEPERAIDIGTSPMTVSPLDQDGLTFYQWYKYTHNNTVDKTLSALFCSPFSKSTHYSDLYIYTENNSVISGPPFRVELYSTGSNGGSPILTAIRANCDIFFKTWLNKGTGSGNIGTLTVLEAPNNGPVQPGDILITADDSRPNVYDPSITGNSQSAFWYDQTGVIRSVSGKFGSCELGVSLGDGKWCIANLFDSSIIIYDKAPELTKLIQLTPSPGGDWVGSIATDFKFFYVITSNDDGDNSTVYRISGDGTIGSKTWTIPGNDTGDGAYSSGLSRDGKILYYLNEGSTVILRYDLINDIVLGPLATVPHGNDIIVLSDNTIIIGDDNNNAVYHYSSSGTLLYTYTAPIGEDVDHLVHNNDDSPDLVWVWLHIYNPFRGRLNLVQLSTGIVIKTFIIPLASQSILTYDTTNSCNPPMWGAEESCPIHMMMTPLIPPNISGIYFINQYKIPRHDSYYNDVEKKIPDPTAKTAVLGE